MFYKDKEEILALACKEGDIQLVRAILKKGVDLYYRDSIAFKRAIMYGHTEIVKAFLDHDYEVEDPHKYVSLAIQYRHKKAIKLIDDYFAKKFLEGYRLRYPYAFYSLSQCLKSFDIVAGIVEV